MSGQVDQAIARVDAREQARTVRAGINVALPSGLPVTLQLPLAMTDADLVALIVALPRLLDEARSRSRHGALVVPGRMVG